LGKSYHLYGLGLIFAISLFAVNAALPDAFAQATSDVTIHTLDPLGDEIFGYFTVLSQGIHGLDVGFTAVTFPVTNGVEYHAGPQNYGDWKFDYWQDTLSTTVERDFTITENTDYYAVYRNIMDSAPTPKLTIKTADSTGADTTGYWTALFKDDVETDNGFSPETFIVNSGESVEVLMGGFLGRAFNNWGDGNTDNPRIFSITSDEMHTAHYNEDNVCNVTIELEDALGNPMPGAFTVFHVYSEGNLDGEGVRLQTGFSPQTLSGGCGDSYQVVVRDSADKAFVEWKADGSTNPWNTYSVNVDTTYIAIYEFLS